MTAANRSAIRLGCASHLIASSYSAAVRSLSDCCFLFNFLPVELTNLPHGLASWASACRSATSASF